MNILENGKLLVADKNGIEYEVKFDKISEEDEFLIWYALEDIKTGEWFDYICVDILNETILKHLKDEGFSRVWQ